MAKQDDTADDADVLEAYSSASSAPEVEVDDINIPFTKWQKSILAQQEEELKSGVAWHPAVRDNDGVFAKTPTVATLRAKVQRDVASWFVQSNGKFILLGGGAMQYGYAEMEKLVPQIV